MIVLSTYIAPSENLLAFIFHVRSAAKVQFCAHVTKRNFHLSRVLCFSFLRRGIAKFHSALLTDLLALPDEVLLEIVRMADNVHVAGVCQRLRALQRSLYRVFMVYGLQDVNKPALPFSKFCSVKYCVNALAIPFVVEDEREIKELGIILEECKFKREHLLCISVSCREELLTSCENEVLRLYSLGVTWNTFIHCTAWRLTFRLNKDQQLETRRVALFPN